MRSLPSWLIAVLVAGLCLVRTAAGADRATEILEATGVKGGLVVHVGCSDGKLTAGLRATDSYLVHGLDTLPGNVEKAREHVRSLGLYGQVSADRFDGKTLPYVDNLVNLVVAEELGEVSPAEIMRVLCPSGVAYVKEGDAWKKTVKPRPAEIDEWTHFLHGPDGNAVARDSVVGPPRHVQWMGAPESARHHERFGSISAVVSSGGRLFSIQDEGPIASILLPSKWFLVARDAFNGVVLWRRPLGAWEEHLRGFRSGPPEVARRLVAAGDRLYVTLGYGKLVCALDAATGETIKTYPETVGTTEIVCREGVLFLVAADAGAERTANAAERRGAEPPLQNRRILVIRADTGDLVWVPARGVNVWRLATASTWGPRSTAVRTRPGRLPIDGRGEGLDTLIPGPQNRRCHPKNGCATRGGGSL